jgi:hypothetical protein
LKLQGLEAQEVGQLERKTNISPYAVEQFKAALSTRKTPQENVAHCLPETICLCHQPRCLQLATILFPQEEAIFLHSIL